MNRSKSRAESETPVHVTIGGRSFDIDARDVPAVERERARLEAEMTEIAALGVQILRFQVPEDGGSPRYEFVFPEGELQYKTRHKLEAAGFDVGQHLVDRRLAFYLSRRVQRSEGWQT